MSIKHKDCSLLSIIENGDFFEISTDELLQHIEREYHDELVMLKSAYSIPDAPARRPDTPLAAPSHTLFGAEFDEINRTLVGVLALRWIHKKDYTSFVGNQPSDVRLTRQSFDWICDIFQTGIKTSSDLYALVTSMVINDLGKSPTLASDYHNATDIDVSKANHDMILYQVVDKHIDLVPSLKRLHPDQQSDLRLGIKLGAEFNFGQFAQAENVPACLSGLEAMRGSTRAFEKKFMEQLLDIAGASGHVDHTCARTLTESVFQAYRNVYEIAVGVIGGELGLRDGYDANLKRKVELLVDVGWTKGRDLNVCEPEDRALMRLLCICRASNAEEAGFVQKTFSDAISADNRNLLVQGLNVDGSLQRLAVLPTYIPAVCSVVIRNHDAYSNVEKQEALAAVFRYLARTLLVTDEQIQRLPQGVTVIERDLRETILHLVESRRFWENPNILDDVGVPDDGIAKMAEGHDWVFL